MNTANTYKQYSLSHTKPSQNLEPGSRSNFQLTENTEVDQRNVLNDVVIFEILGHLNQD